MVAGSVRVILDMSIGRQKWLSKAEERRADRKEEVFESALEPVQSMQRLPLQERLQAGPQCKHKPKKCMSLIASTETK